MESSRLHTLPKVQVNYSIAIELRDELIEIGKRSGCSVSHLIRDMINMYIPVLNKEDEVIKKVKKDNGLFID